MGSNTPQYSHNHIINPETGFLENPAYPHQFDSNRKLQFINLTRNGVGLYTICKQIGMDHRTVFKALRDDSLFIEEVEKARKEYACALETVSKQNALNPKSVIERIFQLKSLFPEKYTDGKQGQTLNVTVNIAAPPQQLEIDQSKVVEMKTVEDQQL